MARREYFKQQTVVCMMTYHGKYPVEINFNQRTLQLASLPDSSEDQKLIRDSRNYVCRQYEQAVKQRYGACLSVTWEGIEPGCVGAPSAEVASV